MVKRKSKEIEGKKNGILKAPKAKKVREAIDVPACFRKGLFDEKVLDTYTKEYAESEPYKHAVIHELMNDDLLRTVRNEVRENVQFTPKETDIYKIHQSGDLANLDGLDDDALQRLPSLLKLRDALYSEEFRSYAAAITGSGKLSGKKTDMAINVYTPGCHLLCHDDVIGSRRISYILYLPDPDIPWKPEWGGALRLYPTTPMKAENGDIATVPSPDFSKVIPPAWNQLSFFTVQPGLSFHDVEEVYHAENKEQLEKEGGRVRMAISGWFHIPQKGEDGYIEGEEARLAEKSSLVQLQGKDEFDEPKEEPVSVPKAEQEEEEGLETEDIDFLLKYLTPHYLTPDTMEQVQEHFEENSAVVVDNILSKDFSEKLRTYVEAQEAAGLPETGAEIEKSSNWKVAKPPHKHKFLYLTPSAVAEKQKKNEELTPVEELVNVLLPSKAFRKWLKVATECEIESYDILGRRFRKGSDYALATGHEGPARLEVCLGFTPTPGWGDDVPEEESEDEEPNEEPKGKKAKAAAKAAALAKAKAKAEKAEREAAEAEVEDDIGGHEVYMAADEEDGNEDAAVYKSAQDEEDDSTLFTNPASWNKMAIVLRDEGVLKFTKYVSRAAKGDRWDVSASFGVKDDGSDDEDEDEMDVDKALEASDDTFEGFSD